MRGLYDERIIDERCSFSFAFAIQYQNQPVEEATYNNKVKTETLLCAVCCPW